MSVQIYLPKTFLFIIYLGQLQPSYLCNIMKKTKVAHSTAMHVKKELLRKKIIAYVDSKSNREIMYRLTDRGEELYKSLTIVIKLLDISLERETRRGKKC